MGASKSFKIAVAFFLGLTLIPKLLTGGTVENPSSEDVVSASADFLASQGYQAIAPIQFAGRPALMAIQESCLIYLIPVAHQGWHQATIRQAVASNQELWFVFEGHLYKDKQDTYYPLSRYYLLKAGRYIGLNTAYPPVLALVLEGSCSLDSIAWKQMPSVPFG